MLEEIRALRTNLAELTAGMVALRMAIEARLLTCQNLTRETEPIRRGLRRPRGRSGKAPPNLWWAGGELRIVAPPDPQGRDGK